MKRECQLNIRIDKELHRQLSIYCAERGISKKQVIEEYLRELLKTEKK